MEPITRTKQALTIDGLKTNQNNLIEVTSVADSLQIAESDFSNSENVYVGGLQLALINKTYYRVVSRGDVLAAQIEIPSSYNQIPVTEIGATAFTSDTSLTKVTIPSSVKLIGANAFYGCKKLASVVFDSADGEDLQIASTAFENCTALTDVIFPIRTTSIGKSAFKGCTNLIAIHIGENNRLVSIGDEAFMNCTALKSVLLSPGLKEIGTRAFAECSALDTFNFVFTITTINGEAFLNCLGLSSFTLPASLTTIGANAFLIDPVPEYSYTRLIAFADPYTWFTSNNDTPDYTDLTLQEPTLLINAEHTMGNKLSLNSTGNLGGFWWHKIKKMPAPEIAIADGILSMTDPLGVAERFRIYVNGGYQCEVVVNEYNS